MLAKRPSGPQAGRAFGRSGLERHVFEISRSCLIGRSAGFLSIRRRFGMAGGPRSQHFPAGIGSPAGDARKSREAPGRRNRRLFVRVKPNRLYTHDNLIDNRINQYVPRVTPTSRGPWDLMSKIRTRKSLIWGSNRRPFPSRNPHGKRWRASPSPQRGFVRATS